MIGLDASFSAFTVLGVVGVGGGLLFVAAVADGLGALLKRVVAALKDPTGRAYDQLALTLT